MPGRHSCKQLLQALVGCQAGADNAGMASHFPLLLLASAALAGCAVVPGPVDYGPAYEPAYPTTIYAAPPAPRIEYPGLPPAAGYVWIDGYWNWGGSRYLWVPGRWAAQHPRPAWGPEFWPHEREPRRPPVERWEERRPPPRPHFDEPDRRGRNEPRAPRPEPPRPQVQPAPGNPAPPVIQQTEPGRAGFMRGLAERGQRPESAPRSAEPDQRRPPDASRRDERGRPVPGEGGERH